MNTKINFPQGKILFIQYKKQIISSLLITLIGIFLLPQIAYFSTISEEKIIELTNQERINNGLDIVTANQLLTKAAYEKGKAILASQTFQHNINGRKFSTWIKETGYEYSLVGENLALDFITSEGALKAWLNSPSHRNNILNQGFTEIGVGVLEGKWQNDNTILVVQIFGTPLAQNQIANKTNYNLSSNWLSNYEPENLLANSVTSPSNINQAYLPATKIASIGTEQFIDFNRYYISRNNSFGYNTNSINNNVMLALLLFFVLAFFAPLFNKQFLFSIKHYFAKNKINMTAAKINR